MNDYARNLVVEHGVVSYCVIYGRSVRDISCYDDATREAVDDIIVRHDVADHSLAWVVCGNHNSATNEIANHRVSADHVTNGCIWSTSRKTSWIDVPVVCYPYPAISHVVYYLVVHNSRMRRTC